MVCARAHHMSLNAIQGCADFVRTMLTRKQCHVRVVKNIGTDHVANWSLHSTSDNRKKLGNFGDKG